MPASISLKQRLEPVLSGRLLLSDLDQNTLEAFRIYAHFRASVIVDSMNPDRIRAELEKIPESVREEVRQECLRQYRRRK
jgi:hypothetical protein